MGQAKQKRPCPAVDRAISAAECGENRLSRYPCPENCVFNPFAATHYQALLEKEARVDRATIDAIQSDPAEFKRFAQRSTGPQSVDSSFTAHASAVRFLFFQRDAAGRTFADRWIATGQREFSNDERVIFRCKTQVRVALLEVRRIIDDRQWEAINLLEPEAGVLRFVDFSTAASAVRFDAYLCWIYPLPHFWALAGNAILLSDVAPLSAVAMLDAYIRHLDGPEDLPARRSWLAENFERIDLAVNATAQERRRQMLSNLDAMFGTVHYELRMPPDQCQTMLGQDPGMKELPVTSEEKQQGYTAAFVCFDQTPSEAGIPGQRLLGRVLVGNKELKAEGLGTARMDELRGVIEQKLGPRIAFARELRQDLGGMELARTPTPDLSLVPPRLLENASQFSITESVLPDSREAQSPGDHPAEFLANNMRRLLDQRVPALKGRTPREAAKAPALRGELIEWVKQGVRLHDQRNLRSGRTDDINGVIRELGLSELDVPAPPLRAIPPEYDDLAENDDEFDDDDGERDDDEEGDDDYGGEDDKSMPRRLTDWSAPSLPKGPLSEKQALKRIHQVLDAFASAQAALDEIERTNQEVLAALDEWCSRDFEPREFSVVLVFVVQVWFAMVPRDTALLLNLPAMKAELDRLSAQFGEADAIIASKQEALMRESPQPNLLRLISENLLSYLAEHPQPQPMRPQVAWQMFCVLEVLVAELDAAVRKIR